MEDWRVGFRGWARVRGIAWFQHQRRHSTVRTLAAVSTQQQGNTHNRGTYRYSVQRDTTDSSVHQTSGEVAGAIQASDTYIFGG